MSEVVAMFLFGGFRDGLKTEPGAKEQYNVCEVFCGGGEVEAAEALVSYADTITFACTPMLAQKDGPGVWVYDVVEKLGERIADAAKQGVVITEDDAEKLAIQMTSEWLAEIRQ